MTGGPGNAVGGAGGATGLLVICMVAPPAS